MAREGLPASSAAAFWGTMDAWVCTSRWNKTPEQPEPCILQLRKCGVAAQNDGSSATPHTQSVVSGSLGMMEHMSELHILAGVIVLFSMIARFQRRRHLRRCGLGPSPE
jgi:hypothetical protein